MLSYEEKIERLSLSALVSRANELSKNAADEEDIGDEEVDEALLNPGTEDDSEDVEDPEVEETNSEDEDTEDEDEDEDEDEPEDEDEDEPEGDDEEDSKEAAEYDPVMEKVAAANIKGAIADMLQKLEASSGAKSVRKFLSDAKSAYNFDGAAKAKGKVAKINAAKGSAIAYAAPAVAAGAAAGKASANRKNRKLEKAAEYMESTARMKKEAEEAYNEILQQIEVLENAAIEVYAEAMAEEGLDK